MSLPGVTTAELDALIYDFVIAAGAIPATIFYRGYRHSSCTSLNDVVCHGIPSDRELKDGDIINIDVTAIVDGWHGDTSRMYLVGDPPLKARRLVDVTYEAMMRGIAAIKPGATTGDLGHAIQAYAEGHSYSVVRDFCGHGVGRVFHDAPNILHYGRAGRGPRLPRRHDLHRRADDQRRQAAREAQTRRLDRGHQGPVALRPVRAHRRRDGDGRRDLHARRPPQAPTGLHKPPLCLARRRSSRSPARDGGVCRTMSAIANACANACAKAARTHCPTTNFSNSCSSPRSRARTSSRSPSACSTHFDDDLAELFVRAARTA